MIGAAPDAILGAGEDDARVIRMNVNAVGLEILEDVGPFAIAANFATKHADIANVVRATDISGETSKKV
jgi:hypothetical protein